MLDLSTARLTALDPLPRGMAMNDQQLYRPPGPEDERGGPADRRSLPVWLLGCLGLFIAVAAIVTLALLLVSRGGEGLAARQGSPQAVVREEATRQLAGRATEEPAEAGSAMEPEGTLGRPSPDSSPQDTAEPTATNTAEVMLTPTPEPTATEPAPAETPAGDDAPRAPQGRIAIVDSQARLWTMAADGADRRLLSEQGRTYQFPSWSPAGDDIAVIGSDFDGSGVYVIADEEGSELRQLYVDATARPIYLYWTPMGQYVSFIAGHPDGLALHLAPVDGAAPSEVVTTSPSTLFWDWMPDGSQVLVHTGFTARESDNSRLAFVPLDEDGEPQEILQRGYFQAPVVAADGRFFSYSDVDPAGNHWLSVRDLERDQQVKLIYHQGVVAMGFSPAAPQLAYISPEAQEDSFYGPLRLVDLEGQESRQLVAETVLAFFWSPDGRSIAYLTLEAVRRPFEFDDAPVAWLPEDSFANGTGQRLGEPKQGTLAKAQTQDGEEARIGLGLNVVDVESGEATLLTVFEPSTVFLNQFLPFFDQYALSHRLWSPDSSALVLPMEDAQDRDFIVVVPVDGSDPLPIARGVAAFWSQQ
ncbi:MAG: hypothetical protein PVG33_02680 [Chloroflexota bacterium]